MATLSLYLDIRNTKEAAPVKIVIRNRNTSAMVSIGVKINADEWDATKCKVIKNPKKSVLNTQIRQRFNEFEIAMNRLFVADSVVSAKEIKKKVINEIYSSSVKSPIFVDYMREFTKTKTSRRTIECYKTTADKIEAFDSSITLEEVTYDWIIRFKNYLFSRGLSNNTVVTLLSKVRATLKNAIKSELISKDPFVWVKIGYQETSKRALSADKIRRIINFIIKPGYHTEKYEEYKVFFQLMLFLRGISIKDLILLKKSDYCNGYIEYNRYKTGKHYIIKVEPEVDALIKRIEGKGEYLLRCMDRKSKHYEGYAWMFNRAIKKMAGDDKITSYCLRHSWATICINDLDISKEIVSAGLGHEMGNRMTSIYIDFDQAKVDDANRKLIDYILYNKK